MHSESRLIFATALGFLILLLSGCAHPAGGDISLLPMYGGVEKTEKQKQADAVYLKQMDAHFDDRRAASESVARAGWNYWYKGEWQTAMRRFNQSWLLDSGNFYTYWGFVAILFAQGKYHESSDMGDIALSLAPDNYKLLCDVAFSKGSYAYKAKLNRKEREMHFQKALSMCEKATTIAPAEPCMAWAVMLFYSGQYQAAWEKVKQAEELGHHYPRAFLTDLARKLPRPESL
jgi:tetratricopeptide (TPR) repeat protein